jgi:hypothetical protein
VLGEQPVVAVPVVPAHRELPQQLAGLRVSSDETDLHAIATASSRHLEVDRP